MEEKIARLIEENAYHCIDCLDNDFEYVDQWATALAQKIIKLLRGETE